MGSGSHGSPGATGAAGERRAGSRGVRWAELSSEWNLANGGVMGTKERSMVVSLHPRVESSTSPRRIMKAAGGATAAAAGDSGNAVVRSSRRGPTRNSASILAMEEVDAAGNIVEAKLGRQDGWSSHTGGTVRSVSSRAGTGEAPDVQASSGGRSLMAEARGKSPKASRVVEFAELQDQTNAQRLPRPRSAKSPTRRIRTVAQEAAPDVQESRSQSRLREPRFLRGRVESPSRTRADDDDLQDVMAEIIHDHSLTLEKAARRQVKGTRQARIDSQEPSNENPSGSFRSPSAAETQEEIQAKAAARRARTRRHKRKTDGTNDPSSEEAPERGLPDDRPSTGLPGSHQSAPRKTTARESTSDASTWAQMFGDVLMWRDIPRSTLFFGAGLFFVLSASYMRDTRLGALTFTSYLALLYLAGVYCHRNFLGGGIADASGLDWKLSESEAFELMRRALPAVNAVLSKCGQLFSGDPFTTLKVATMLWFLAQAGYYLSIWSFARLAFIAMFSVPKLVSSYSHHLQGQAHVLTERFWKSWDAYAHKKAAMAGVFIVAWNLSSMTARLFGAFVMLVAVRAYYGQLVELEEVQDDHKTFPARQHEEARAPIVSPSPERVLRRHPLLKEVKTEPS